MDIFIALISVAGITGLIWFLNHVLPFKICPICAGVSGTWIWLLIGISRGYQINLIVPAMLIGGSVVGLVYQLERKIQFRWPIFWKTLFVVFGFWVGYSLIIQEWIIALVSGLCLIIFTYLFSLISPSKPRVPSELEKKMNGCC